MVIFCSGSCRINLPLSYLHTKKKINLINTHYDLEPSTFLGNFHNAQDHLSLFKLLEDDRNQQEIEEVLYAINRKEKTRRDDWMDVWLHCKSMWTKCNTVVIEMSSKKSVHSHWGSVNWGSVNWDQARIIMKDIEAMVGNRRLLWVSHFRPSIIWPKESKHWSDTREAVYDAVKTGTNFFDPSPYIKEDPSMLLDESHYSSDGIKKISEVFYEHLTAINSTI